MGVVPALLQVNITKGLEEDKGAESRPPRGWPGQSGDGLSSVFLQAPSSARATRAQTVPHSQGCQEPVRVRVQLSTAPLALLGAAPQELGSAGLPGLHLQAERGPPGQASRHLRVGPLTLLSAPRLGEDSSASQAHTPCCHLVMPSQRP